MPILIQTIPSNTFQAIVRYSYKSAFLRSLCCMYFIIADQTIPREDGEIYLCALSKDALPNTTEQKLSLLTRLAQ